MWRIESRPGLSPAELSAVRLLAQVCEEDGGQDLKVTPRERDDTSPLTQFLALSGERIVGYCGVDEGTDAEICGMVHPGSRFGGIGSALLGASLAATGALGKESALVICEEAHHPAIDWMRRRGATLDSSELRMVRRLDGSDGLPSGASGLELRPARADDAPVLRRLLGDGFPGTEVDTLDAMISRTGSGDEPLVAWEGGDTVGTLRVYHTPARSMVYGLVIDRALRGRGYGRAVMVAALEVLGARGVGEVSLEVLPENEAAVRLYTRLGFTTSTTYRYMRLVVRPA